MQSTPETRRGLIRHGLCIAWLFLGWVANPALAGKEPRQVRDLHYGEVLFHFYQGAYFPAITHLLAADMQGRMPNHPIDSQLLLGGMELSYGMNREATRVFRELLDQNAEERVRNRIWFSLGKIGYQRGYLPEAEDALKRVTTKVSREVRGQQQLLLAQVLMQQGKYHEAAELLRKWKGPKSFSGYAEYNLGVALIKSGDGDAGVEQLAAVGDLKTKNSETYSLRDKANLTLGLHLLDTDRADLARQHLNRVRLSGPFASLALLGAGWADTKTGNFQSALVPWNELLSRPPADPAVQEALVAMPHALAQLNARAEAVQHYERAIDLLSEESGRLDAMIGNIEQVLFPHTQDEGVFVEVGVLQQALMVGGSGTGRLAPSDRNLGTVPDRPETGYLVQLLALHEFQEAWKNYYDLQYLAANLTYWSEQIETYDAMLANRREAYSERMPRVEAAQETLNPETVRERWHSLRARVDEIGDANDYLALATTQEGQMWQKLKELDARLERLPATDTYAPLKDKQRLLAGVLRWQLNASYKERLWQARKMLKDLEQPLVEAREARASLDRAMAEATHHFEGYDDQIGELRTRIKELQPRIVRTLARQGEYLRNLALKELELRRQNLKRYVLQARFALAATYDEATNARGDVP
jgi:hypothetical protein